MKLFFSPRNLFFNTAVLVFLSLSMNAQPGCPAVNAGNDVQLPCGTNCTTLTATPFQVGSTGTYGVSQIPYTPFAYNTGTAVLVHTDDLWSGVVTLPFNFCFFDTVYNHVIIGSNGDLSFNTANANNYNPWPISTPIPSANDISSEVNNGIMGPWEDIDPTNRGSIYYQIIGTAPCRIFVVSWFKTGYYGDVNSTCGSCYSSMALFATSQVVLYETTNVIEIYIQQKQDLPAWNSGYAVEGIENNSATVAYTVPGRNATVWTATNDAWRFTPNGPSIVNVSWYNGATQISTDSSAHVCPSATTTYTAKAVYTPCSGGTPVTVTDNVTVSLSGTLNAGVDSVVNVSCPGLANGSAYAHVSGGVAPVNYGWSNGSTALAIHNLAPGTYSFSVSDGSGCLRIDTFVITNPSPIGVSGISTNPACHGNCNGNVATTDTGGTGGPYTYLWNTNPVQTTQTATNLCADNYAVTVTDGNGCTGHASFTLTDPAAMVVNQVSLTNVSCHGSGSIVVAAGGGYNGPVAFQWSNGETGASDTALSHGNYQVTATDSLGCSASAAYVITQPANGIVIQAPVITNISCFGNANGAIVANANGGSGQLTYTWTRVSTGTQLTGQAINNLGADTYILTVTDANGCTDTANYSVTSPPQIIIDSIINSVAICASANGHARVYAHGGTGTFTYKWSSNPSVTTSSITGLSGGSYSVTVTDASGCSVSAGFSIYQASPVVVSVVNQTNVACYGGNNGSITVSASGGISPYNYTWNGGISGPTDANLVVGSYTVSVTDSIGCSASKVYTISQPVALSFNAPDIQNLGCTVGVNGSVTANPAGGTPGYSYAWVQQSNSATYNTQTISNLNPDTYNVTVTDANGCNITASYAVITVPPLNYSIDSTNVLCAGGNNGSIKISISSGTPPYQYTFNNTNSTDSLYNNLYAGLVDVRIHDGSGCTAENFVNIQQPQPLVIDLDGQTNVTCNGGNDGKLAVHFTGGVAPYTPLWSNNTTVGSTTDSALTAGNYSITVTDANACTATKSYQITQPTALISAPVVVNALCFAASDGSIDANPSGGTAPYTFAWSDGNTMQKDSGLIEGTYTCTIQDVNGCSLVITDTIGQPTKVVISDSVRAVRCFGQHTGEAFIFPTGGVPPYDYSATNDWSNFVYSTDGVIQGLDTGVYYVNVRDYAGCVNLDTIYIPSAVPDSFSTRADSTLCYGPNYCDGAAFVGPLVPQNGPFTFLLNNTVSQDTGYFQKLCAGLNVIVVTNAYGCLDTVPIIIPQPLPMQIAITPDSVTIPLGGSQSVLVTYQNVTNPSYNWTPFVGLSCGDCPNPVVNPYNTSDYMLVVSMENGPATCYDTAFLHVSVLPHTRAYVPNAFTPNGDGNNDKFEIYGEDIKTISLKIFNRWGEKVFETTNSLAGWDGTYKGVAQNIGVYTYEAIITYLDDTQETKNGTVTLLR